MSNDQLEKITCPKCGHEQEVMFDIIDDGYFFTIFYEEEGADPGVVMMDMEVYKKVKEQYEDVWNTCQTDGFQDICFEWARNILFGV